MFKYSEVPPGHCRGPAGANSAHGTSMNPPLVSVLMFCRNGNPRIRRSIESVLGQSYGHIQYVVQDAASTDGTFELLRSYGSRIELVSEPDSGTNEGFWRALQRCRGDYFCACLADEELMPSAIERAVELLEADKRIGSITGDAYLTNEHGIVFGTHVGQTFDLLGYLLGDYCPNFSASFFRRSALDQIGFFTQRWKSGNLDTIEFEIWCRLGIEHRVQYIPYIFSKYGIHEGQMSNVMPRIIGELDSRQMIISKFLFGKDGFFGENEELKQLVVYRQFEIILNHLNAYKRLEEAQEIRRRMNALLEQPKTFVAGNGLPPGGITPAARLKAAKAIAHIRRLLPSSIRDVMPLEAKLSFERHLQRFFAKNSVTVDSTRVEEESDTKNSVLPTESLQPRKQYYQKTALIYAARGQLDQAWETWQHAGALDDYDNAAIAQQVLMKSPSIDEEKYSMVQEKWAARYAQPLLANTRYEFTPPRNGKITIAYHCGFWATECAKAQALSVISAHDRSRFRVIGYTPTPENSNIAGCFDLFESNGTLGDKEFVDAVRQQGVDVFVELTGLSRYHRLGAMATRCAPVQIVYLNHHGSSRVPNVDYIVADGIAAPKTCDIHYTEQIYRLPRCFFAFEYDVDDLPEVAPPPHLANGYITFGCFGSGEKLNGELLRVWADILLKLPNARLLLQNQSLNSSSNRHFIEKTMVAFGVEADRLTLLRGTDRNGVLENYSRVDISLDTWPYSGGNTIAESVWQGVPVISLRGDRMASAYGASLVTGCGLPDLVAQNFEEYSDIAVRLANDSRRLTELRRSMRSQLRENDFGNPRSLARALEDAYCSMLSRRWNGAFFRPKNFDGRNI